MNGILNVSPSCAPTFRHRSSPVSSPAQTLTWFSTWRRRWIFVPRWPIPSGTPAAMFWARSICSRPADARASNGSSMPRRAGPATGRRCPCRRPRTPRWSRCRRTRPRKLAAELYLCAYAEMYGISPISLALGSVYGPRQNPHGDSGVVAVFGSALLAGHPVTIYGDGTAVRDYVYIDDVVDAFVCAASAAPSGDGDLQHRDRRTDHGQRGVPADRGRPWCVVSASLLPRPEPVRCTRSRWTLTEASQELGWKPSIKLVDGIQRTIHWLRGTR